MPRPDKLRATWDETGSEEEESTSYNIPSPNILTSEDENPEPSPSQYKHDRLVKRLEQMRDLPSTEEDSDDEQGDYISFPLLGKSFYCFWCDATWFETGDGDSEGDKKKKNIDALTAKIRSMEKEIKFLRKQAKAGPVKDYVRSPPFSSAKKLKSAAGSASRSHFDPPLSSKQLVPESSDSDKDSVATDSTRSSRKRFLAPWTRVGVRYHDEHPIEQIWEWMAMVCDESYKDAGPSSIRKNSEDDLGPFKLKRVRVCCAFQFFRTFGEKCALGLI
jgi:hypothetical protein